MDIIRKARINRALRRARSPVHPWLGLALVGLIGPAFAGCALQALYVTPETTADGGRLASRDRPSPPTDTEPNWWAAFGDPVMDRLVADALATHPSVDRAMAAVVEVRAQVRASRAARLPAVSLTADAARERGDPSPGATTADVGLSLSWEVDMFGRIANETAASASRLEARLADQQAARLSLAADTADAVLGRRACDRSVAALEADIASREIVLSLTRHRRDAGLDADIDVAQAESGLESARTALALRRQDCAGLTNALVFLTGAPRTALDAAFAEAPEPSPAPPMPTALRADTLLTHPGVAAADRAASAAWSDIAVARAEAMPRLDLRAVLTGQWIRAMGNTSDSRSGVLGLNLTAPLFDGGKGAANVQGAEARYLAAVAELDIALRTAERDVQDALAAANSAQDREVSATMASRAADFTLRAREAQWRAGAVSQFEIESARRDAVAALDTLISASRDATQAWVALIRAAGPNAHLQESAAQ